MPWTNDAFHPFAGILEKLKRANENIVNLNIEISDFFKGCKYPVIPNPNSQEWQEAVNYHKSLVIPLRCSVLSGEIIHHLRSCLDHVAWHFSSAQRRTESENAIEFPVFREVPAKKDELSRYERKVKGITNPLVLDLIKKMQPYNRGRDPEDDPLCIVHDLDRFDKHRELNLISSCAQVTIYPHSELGARLAFAKHSQGETLTVSELALMSKALNHDVEVSPQVAFAQFGKRKDQFVIPGLTQLHKAIFQRIDLFADLV